MNGLSDFLYARPSFIEGMGRVIDVGDTMTEYNRALSGEQADWLALFADWRMVGQDILGTIAAARTELSGERPSVATKEEAKTK